MCVYRYLSHWALGRAADSYDASHALMAYCFDQLAEHLKQAPPGTERAPGEEQQHDAVAAAAAAALERGAGDAAADPWGVGTAAAAVGAAAARSHSASALALDVAPSLAAQLPPPPPSAAPALGAQPAPTVAVAVAPAAPAAAAGGKAPAKRAPTLAEVSASPALSPRESLAVFLLLDTLMRALTSDLVAFLACGRRR